MSYPINGTNQEKYDYVYQKAKELGDRFPEITASQFALETAYGKKTAGKNNVFNQTAKGDTLKNRKWVNYKSIDDSIKARVNKWSSKYKDAPDAVSALAIIQPSYAPNKDKNQGYISNVMKIAKRHGKYEGSTKLPNADVSPTFYSTGKYRNFYNDNNGVAEDFFTEVDKIQSSKISEEEKNKKIMQLRSDYAKEGKLDIINNKLDSLNKEDNEKRELIIYKYNRL